MTDLLTNRDALDELFSLTPEQIEGLPWVPVDGSQGVHYKILWRLGSYVQSLTRYDAGATSKGDPHLAAHHHIWVVAGAMTFAGHRLEAGSYMHVPPGVRHMVTDVAQEGCTFLQMYRPHPPVEAAALAGSD
jgi:glyoxylate utilization-related uncharacterized protein